MTNLAVMWVLSGDKNVKRSFLSPCFTFYVIYFSVEISFLTGFFALLFEETLFFGEDDAF